MDIFWPFLFFITSLTISLTGNYLVLNFAKTLGIRNNNNVLVRWSNESKPSLGGVSMYVVFLVTCILILLFFIDETDEHQIPFLGLFLAATAGFAMGLADDAYDTKPFLKLLIQILCGFIFVFTDNALNVFQLDILNDLATVFWVVTLMNSLNMLDNMDGITGITSIWVLFGCLLVYILQNGWVLDVWTILMISCTGTMIGFLFFNVHPSKMFMGDGGSQFVGVVIAFFTIRSFMQNSLAFEIDFPGVVMAVACLTPAAADTLTVVINRLKRGQSPMIGGKDHTTHHLVYSGKNDFQVWLIFLGIGLLSVVATIAVYQISQFNLLGSVLLGASYFLVVFVYLYRNTIKYKAP